MKIVPARPFTFEGDNKELAVLLLHGFTGNTADVRMLGRFLQKRGYTSHAPLYKGHGVPPEQLVHTGPDDWWQNVMEGYQFLKNKGFEKIVACGLSLGGVFSLKLGYTEPIAAVIPMCAPVYIKSEEVMYKGILTYAREYKKREEKTDEQIETEMQEFEKTPMPTLKALQQLIADVKANVDQIYAPTFVVQARHDDMINTDSANIIFNEVQTDEKKLKWYEESGHVITLDKERYQVEEDIFEFIHNLNW